MAHVYGDPDGLGGDWYRASGPEYEKLRQEVIDVLYALEDKDGTKPVMNAIPWEDAPAFFELPTDRIGDIVLEVRPTYFWFEEVDNDLTIFTDPVTSGYKQTLNAKENQCMWTPFVLWGPGVRKGISLSEPISHVDQLPTLLHLMGIDIPEYVQGRVLTEILE